MSYRTIVVGTDGSPTASVAVEVAQKLAKRLHGTLVLVGALDAYGVSRQPLQTALYEAAEAARAKKVDAIAELIEGTPGESILAAAIKHEADLIVVGNRGMGQATRFRLGSVPDWIAHDAPCDLLIVDTTGRAGPREPAPPYMRILAGTDGSGTATEAVRKAYTLASVYAGTVTLVHVGDPLVGAIKLEEVASTRPEDVEVEKRTVEGDPAQRICELAESEDVQLVVVGNKGMSGVRRFLGSVPKQGRPRGALGRLDREDRGPFGGRSRRRPRGIGERRRSAARRLSRRGRPDVRALVSLHAHGLHGRLERLRQDVGLSRATVRGSASTDRWSAAPRPSHSNAWEARLRPRNERRREARRCPPRHLPRRPPAGTPILAPRRSDMSSWARASPAPRPPRPFVRKASTARSC